MNSQPVSSDQGNFADRLKIALNQRSGRSIALKAGVSTSVFSQYMTGKTQPALPHLVALAKALGVKVEWLATGEGPMSADSPPPRPRKPDLTLFDASALDLAMRQLDLIEREEGRRLGPDARAAAITGLYLALMKDRADGQPDPEIE